MQKPNHNLLILFSLFLFAGLAIPLVNFLNTNNVNSCGQSSNLALKNIGLELNLIHEDGEEIYLKDLVDGYTLVYFGYSFCPDVCPIDLGRNVDAISLLNEAKYPVLPIFITVDPQRDNPKRLVEYTNLLDDRLIGLTGSRDQIKEAKKNFMVYSSENGSEESYLVDHSTFTYLIDNTGKLLWHFKRQDRPEYMKEIIECLVDLEKI